MTEILECCAPSISLGFAVIAEELERRGQGDLIDHIRVGRLLDNRETQFVWPGHGSPEFMRHVFVKGEG